MTVSQWGHRDGNGLVPARSSGERQPEECSHRGGRHGASVNQNNLIICSNL